MMDNSTKLAVRSQELACKELHQKVSKELTSPSRTHQGKIDYIRDFLEEQLYDSECEETFLKLIVRLLERSRDETKMNLEKSKERHEAAEIQYNKANKWRKSLEEKQKTNERYDQAQEQAIEAKKKLDAAAESLVHVRSRVESEERLLQNELKNLDALEAEIPKSDAKDSGEVSVVREGVTLAREQVNRSRQQAKKLEKEKEKAQKVASKADLEVQEALKEKQKAGDVEKEALLEFIGSVANR